MSQHRSQDSRLTPSHDRAMIQDTTHDDRDNATPPPRAAHVSETAEPLACRAELTTEAVRLDGAPTEVSDRASLKHHEREGRRVC